MQVTFKVNDREVTLSVPPERRLVDILREDLRLTGTKLGCGEGECGACTVIMNDLTVNSCLIPACQLGGSNIWTIEGLEKAGAIEDIKKAFTEAGAVQCGYCIPGMVISAHTLLRKAINPTEHEIREAMAGNLCRCTGYAKIISAVRNAADIRQGGSK
jgi:carbon-monoxide dehydrogenase small subunit